MWCFEEGGTLLHQQEFIVDVGVSPDVLTDSFTGLRDRLGGYRDTRLVRLSIVSKRFIPGVAVNTPIVGTVGTIYSIPFSIRLVVSRPLGCVTSFTSTNTSVVAFRVRDRDSIRGAVSGVVRYNYGTTLTIGPNARVRTICPCLGGLSVILIVAIRPNFNNRDFVTSVVPGVRGLHTGYPSVSVRISNNMGTRAVGAYTGTKTGIFITNDTIFGDRGPRTAVGLLGRGTKGIKWRVGGGHFCGGVGHNRG